MSVGILPAHPLHVARRSLFKFYWWAEQKLVPGLRSSQYAYYEALRAQLEGRHDWLDLGCGHQVFADWMTREQAEVLASRNVIGIDLDWTGLRHHPGLRSKVFGDLRHLPIRSGSMDLITANMVVEHLDDPAQVLREAHRVLRPGGAFVFHTPSYYNWMTRLASAAPDAAKKLAIRILEGRAEEDVFPTYYRMNTVAAIRRHAAATDFDVHDVGFHSGSAALVMLGPVVVFELLYIRLLQRKALERLRSNIVVVLTKPAPSALPLQ